MNYIYNITNKISKSFTHCLLIIMICFGSIAANAQTKVFLSSGGSGTQSGATWNNAMDFNTWYNTYDSNLKIPANTSVYVKKGDYILNKSSTLSPVLDNPNILIQGGFPLSATGTDISGYNPAANTTKITLNVVLNQPTIFTSGITGPATNVMEIKGFTITQTGSNCKFFTGINGGTGCIGIFKFTDLLVTGFSGAPSAVMFRDNGSGSQGIFNNCVFSNNSSTSVAAAINNDSATTPLTIINCSFTQNSTAGTVAPGGAIFTRSNLTATNSSWCGNSTASNSGGAVGNSISAATLSFTGCTFSKNETGTNTSGVGAGGAVYIQLGNLIVDQCSFYENISRRSGGGALYVRATSTGNHSVSNSVFYKNHAIYISSDISTTDGGGAIFIDNTSRNYTITNTKFVSNDIINPSSFAKNGGAIMFYNNFGSNSVTLTNCLFSGNNLNGAAPTNAQSDISAFRNSASDRYIISNSQMQLAAQGNYVSSSAGGTNSFSFGTGNTFGNTSDGGVGTPTFSCPTVITNPCLASNDSNPVLSTTTITNTCPSKTVDLTTITATNQNSDVTLTWHTGSTPSDANKVATPTAVTQGGTYYAAFYDSIGGCYSAGSTSVSVIIGACAVVNNICPAITVDLTTLVNAGSLPITWHTGTPANDGNKVATSTAVGAGTYYAAFYDATGGCYSPTTGAVTVTIKLCVCTQPATAGTPDGYTQTGISSLQGFAGGWPGNIPNGFIAIESKNKGFVITRTTESAIPAAGLVEGMLIYDTADNCVKLYNGTSWHCIAKTCNIP